MSFADQLKIERDRLGLTQAGAHRAVIKPRLIRTKHTKKMKTIRSIKYQNGSTSRINVSVVNDSACEIRQADNPELAYKFWLEIIAEQPDHEPEKESVCVIMLNARMRPYAWNRVSLGTCDESSCHPREIFRPVIMSAASGFILMHNHPSGDPSPSRADEVITRRVNEASELLRIRFFDHVIVGKPSPGRSPYYSFREAGIIS